MDCSPPGSSVYGILQARVLEWVAFPPPEDLPDPGIEPVSLVSLVSPVSPALARGFCATAPPVSTNSIHEALSSKPNHLSRPQLPIPSSLRIRILAYVFWGTQTFSP